MIHYMSFVGKENAFLKEPLTYVCVIVSCGVFNVAAVHQIRKISLYNITE